MTKVATRQVLSSSMAFGMISLTSAINVFFTYRKIKKRNLVLQKPLQRDVLIRSVRQRSTYRDGEYSSLEFLKGDVDGI